MKVKEFIAILQECDGEEEVTFIIHDSGLNDLHFFLDSDEGKTVNISLSPRAWDSAPEIQLAVDSLWQEDKS